MLFNRRDPLFGVFNELARAQDEFNRIFNVTGGSGTLAGPRINLWEDDHNLYAETDLPGVADDQIEIMVKEGNQLTVQAERAAPAKDNATWYRQERPYGQFQRSISLPVLVDADRVEAALENGVLKLILPKSEAAKPRKITVKGS